MPSLSYSFSMPAAPVVHSEARIAYKACPVCASERFTEHRLADCRHHPMYKPGLPSLMRWMCCTDCQHVFTDGYWSDASLKKIFSSVNPHQLPGNDPHGSRAVSARMVEKVIRFTGAPAGLWVDVGFGNGALIGAAEEYGFSVAGLDLRTQAVELMRLDGVDAWAQDFCEFTPSEPLSVVSMADVLEHVPYPIPVLEHAREVLREDGILFLSMPNDECYAWRMLDRKQENPYWAELEHYHNFGRKRLFDLLHQQGFEPLSYGISERYYLCMEVIARKR